MKKSFFIVFILFILVFLFFIYSMKQKKFCIGNNVLLGTSKLGSDIHIALTREYDISAKYLFYARDPNTFYVCVGISYKDIHLSLQNLARPTEANIYKLLSRKNLKFFCYKLTKDKDIFYLTLIRENACFTLNSLEIDHILDVDYCYTFRCTFVPINQYTYEDIFFDNMNGTPDKCTNKHDIFYLPIKKEKIILKNK